MQHLQKTRGGEFFPFWKSLHGLGEENSHFLQVLSFHILPHSLARCKTQLLYFQWLPHSLPQNTRWGAKGDLSGGNSNQSVSDGLTELRARPRSLVPHSAHGTA